MGTYHVAKKGLLAYGKDLGVGDIMECGGLPFVALFVYSLSGGTLNVQVSADGVNFILLKDSTGATVVPAVGRTTIGTCRAFKVAQASGTVVVSMQGYASGSGD